MKEVRRYDDGGSRTCIDNEILDAMIVSGLTALEMRAVMFIVRASDAGSYSVRFEYWNEFEHAGIKKCKVKSVLERLLSRRIFNVDWETKTVGINTNVSDWCGGVSDGYAAVINRGGDDMVDSKDDSFVRDDSMDTDTGDTDHVDTADIGIGDDGFVYSQRNMIRAARERNDAKLAERMTADELHGMLRMLYSEGAWDMYFKTANPIMRQSVDVILSYPKCDVESVVEAMAHKKSVMIVSALKFIKKGLEGRDTRRHNVNRDTKKHEDEMNRIRRLFGEDVT